MSNIAAFIGHSFDENDKDLIRTFTDYFDDIKKILPGFTWDHAEDAEPKTLSEKVVGMMRPKNLFIGICTARERAVSPHRVSPPPLLSKKLWGRSEDFEWKTSDWIIQEIGLARGLGLHNLILLEEGVRRPGGLQGDLEHVPFNRLNPSASFPKILQMLSTFTPPTPIQGSIASEQGIVTEKALTSTALEKGKPQTSTPGTESEFDTALFDAMFTNDTAAEQALTAAFAASPLGADALARARFEATGINLRRIFGKALDITRLRELATAHPEEPHILWCLGNAYRFYEEYGKAAESYERAAQSEATVSNKIIRLKNAAVAKAKSGQQHCETWLLDQALPFLNGDSLATLALLRGLKDLASSQKLTNKVQVYAEELLALEPGDDELRASLAWEYMDSGNNALSLLHYSLLPIEARTGGHWNNLGVVRVRLRLKGKGTAAYQKAETLGESLAMSNLAFEFIQAGFLKEAQEMCNRAVTIKDYDNQVNLAFAKLNEVKEEEDTKEKTIKSSIDREREFYVTFATACLKRRPNNAQQNWKAQHCVLRITIKDGILLAEGAYEIESSPPSFGFGGLVQAIGAGTSSTMRTNVRYEGEFTGLAVHFKRWTTKEGITPSLLAIPNEDKGMIIFSEDLLAAKVFVKSESESQQFFDTQRVD